MSYECTNLQESSLVLKAVLLSSQDHKAASQIYCLVASEKLHKTVISFVKLANTKKKEQLKYTKQCAVCISFSGVLRGQSMERGEYGNVERRPRCMHGLRATLH